MTDETREPDDEDVWEAIEASLDEKSVPEQVAWLRGLVDKAKADLFIAHQLAQRIVAAAEVGVLGRGEGESFAATVTEQVKDLQAMLVLNWSGANSEREILEQLHLIYYPLTRPDGGSGYTLDDHMFQLRQGLPLHVVAGNVPEGSRLRYWEMLREYVETHPNEPPGWREALERRQPDATKKRSASRKKQGGAGKKQAGGAAKGKWAGTTGRKKRKGNK
jgi:hypothetical protein